MNLNRTEIARYMDHTMLKPQASADDIDRAADEAKRFQTASVCVNSYWVPRVATALAGSSVKTGAAIGFPLGAASTAAKVAEATDAVAAGAEEIDMVMNIGELKGSRDQIVLADIVAVADAVHAGSALLKVILECCLLTDEEKRRACRLAVSGRADFVKTSTGFSTGGATVHDVELMRAVVGPDFGVKAAGGIHTAAEARALIEAGANRLGVSGTAAILAEASA
ncbi:deoxyribose-phosphate aldolase [Coriobacterium glomerans PW2]|uniref:Deoxyribose-phosphate aldolase n=1 Tax=Coriobacterium glomerans (strain ATCC 49209 / DSM 20642 / JCM 10262 / PW2) TaxID=700015 RepID=F2NB95_CORGP|nr:deoxyribose-phosphate aldolase [Coriobacterium glomerans]AEB06631.1 deoxyribose-phosphate aldolase [Coriobacterium glomerans PW2]